MTAEALHKFQSASATDQQQQLDELEEEVVSLPIPATPVMGGRHIAAAGAGAPVAASAKKKEQGTDRAGINLRKRRH